MNAVGVAKVLAHERDDDGGGAEAVALAQVEHGVVLVAVDARARDAGQQAPLGAGRHDKREDLVARIASLHDGATRLTASVVEPVTRNSYGLLALSSAGVNVGAQQRNRRRARVAATDHRRARAVGARLVGAALAALAVAAVGAARLAGAVGRALRTGARRALGAAGSVERPEALARRLLAEVGGAGVAVVVAGGARRGTTGAVDKVLHAVAKEAVGAGDVEEEDVAVHGAVAPSCSGETQTASSASAPGRTGSAPS